MNVPDAPPVRFIFAADDPLVLNGTYDREGYKPGERERIAKARARAAKGSAPMKLFDVAKVGCFCDGVTHGLEKRRGEEVKVLTLRLRVAPFDAKLATAMPDGVKPTLFKLNTGDPKDALRRVDFALGVERQMLRVFAASDMTTGTRAIDQVRIHGTYARSQKDRNGFDFVFKATFGPVGRDELEFVQGWLLSQKFVTFEAAEPGMFEESTDDDDEPSDADEKARRPALEFETESSGAPLEEASASPRERAHRPLHSHQQKKKTGRSKPAPPPTSGKASKGRRR